MLRLYNLFARRRKILRLYDLLQKHTARCFNALRVYPAGLIGT